MAIIKKDSVCIEPGDEFTAEQLLEEAALQAAIPDEELAAMLDEDELSEHGHHDVP